MKIRMVSLLYAFGCLEREAGLHWTCSCFTNGSWVEQLHFSLCAGKQMFETPTLREFSCKQNHSAVPQELKCSLHGYIVLTWVKWNRARSVRDDIFTVEKELCLLEGTHSNTSDWGEYVLRPTIWTQWGMMSCVSYGLDSPGGIAPAHQPRPTWSLAEPKAKLILCRRYFLLHTDKRWATQETSFSLHFRQCLNCSRHSCMFHTHSVITFVLLKGDDSSLQPRQIQHSTPT